jgi:RNA polymerase sigma factor (sigma-70 family)
MIGDLPAVEKEAVVQAVTHAAVTPPPGFEEFYRSEYRTLVKTAILAGARTQDAEDAAGAAMADILQRWEQISNPLAYGRVATLSNFIKDKERGLRRIRQRMVERGDVMQEITEITGITVWEDREWVNHLLESLPPAQREVMDFIVDGFRPADIARLLGRTPEAVRQNLLQARKRLRQEFLEQDARGTISRSAVKFTEEAR